MFVRTRAILFVLLSSAFLIAQNTPDGVPKQKTRCMSVECKAQEDLAAANTPPPVPSNSKWKLEDFRVSDATVNCSVVKYESALARPMLHLICPEQQVFAPLRVHLMLTWRQLTEIPPAMRSMLVDTSRVVRFKSPEPGISSVELTFQDPKDSRSVKQWITFNDVNVGLVLTSK